MQDILDPLLIMILRKKPLKTYFLNVYKVRKTIKNIMWLNAKYIVCDCGPFILVYA